MVPTDIHAQPDPDSTYLGNATRRRMISVRGARTHNLKSVDIDIPRDQLVVITGLSGSGKSSLAFDTLYAEGQRRYVESLSVYARQFLQLMEKPDVDLIEGLSPAIAIEQKATSHNPRSTVGTVTEIHDYLRLLFARAGTPHCPTHHLPLQALTISQMTDDVLTLPADTRLLILAPTVRARKGDVSEELIKLQSAGYVRVRVDGVVRDIDEAITTLQPGHPHDIDVVIDRLKVKPDVRQRIAESLEAAVKLAEGCAAWVNMDSGEERRLNARFACPQCDYALPPLEPRLFSFNSPSGACPACDGLGCEDVFDAGKVVAFPTLSLASGAIKGWDRRNGYYFSMLESVATHAGFDIDAPFESLTTAARTLVLNGSGLEKIRFTYSVESGAAAGRKLTKPHPFEGIIPNMARRYRETDSAVVREDLARYRSTQSCTACAGTRLRTEARFVTLGSGPAAMNISQVGHLTLSGALAHFQQLQLDGQKAAIAHRIVQEVKSRLGFLNDVGVGYLSLDRSADTLSGGEAQRIRLASQIGSGLTGVMYVLDEPSIGLHQRDNARLIDTLKRLRDLGNSVIVVEHDEDMIAAADFVVDMGPAAGVHGGHVIASGTPAAIRAQPASITGQFLSGVRRIAIPAVRRQPADAWVALVGATGHNLRHVTTRVPVGLMTCVTGVSGSGKSTLINDTLYATAAARIQRAGTSPAPCEEISGLEAFDKVINVDQSPIGRTPRSNPATYTGLLTPIRELLAEMPSAKERGYGPGRFSFNVAAANGGGRCEACQGDGVIKVEMHFLPDVYVPCEVCHGARFNRETLEVLYKGLNIAQILDLTVEEAHRFFAAVPAIARKLQTLMDVGLSYITLGQSATTLSGGEAQRVKLALELSRRDTGKTLYVLDEPTTGLHFVDIELLLHVLHRLVNQGNTVVIIEHNLDVIKTADWIIDMGPEGGAGGGTVVAQGTPEQVAAIEASHTGRYLRRSLNCAT